MSDLKITGSAYIIRDIFNDDYDFEIPHYQRPYAWQTEESDELLDDLIESLGEGETINIEHTSEYFLGSIVLIKNETTTKSVVVDGQQRLITLTILLSVLREYLADEHRDMIRKFIYDKGDDLLGTSDRYRLKPRSSDETFFQKYIQDSANLESLQQLELAELSDSQKNLALNAMSYHETLAQLSQLRCKSIASYLIRKCKLVIVSSEDQDSAYRIFSVLNDRGLDLSHADILKAELVGNVVQKSQDAYAIKWENIETQLGRKPFDDVFSHIRMIYRRTKLKGTVLKEFRDYVVKSHQPDKLIDDVLIPYAEKYDQLLTASFEFGSHEKEINQIVNTLDRIDNVDWIPPALSYLMKNHGSPNKILEFLRDLERLAASMMIMRVNINNRIKRYGKLLQEIEKSGNLSLGTSALQLDDDEKLLTLNNIRGNLYEQAAYRLYVLLRLDQHLAGEGATYDHRVISIEHVLPQNPDPKSDWVKNFPDEEERNDLVHQIGNLVLLSRRKNSSAKNYDFEKKKTSYFVKDGISPFVITGQIVGKSKWNVAVVKRRQTELIKKLAALWRLN